MLDDTDPAIERRIDRARTEPIEFSVVELDPAVLFAENDESGRVHTVIPGAMHCSCEDHTYRKVPCKHLIALLDSGLPAGELLAERLREHRHELEQQEIELRDRLDEVTSEQDQITALLSELDISQAMHRTVDDVVEVARADEPEDVEPTEPGDGRDELESMVADLMGDGGGDDE